MRNSPPVSWVKAARKDFAEFPIGAQIELARALTILAEGGMPDIAKPLMGLGSGVMELALKHKGDAFRVVYALQIGAEIWVIHAFQKKSTSGTKTPKHEIDLVQERLRQLREAEMNEEDFDIIHGSGNVFRDLGHPDADREQLRALLAAEIISVLDERKLTVRDAHELTGIAAADFSRIRQVKLDRFTIDRLMSILGRLGQQVDVTVVVHPSEAPKRGVEVRL